MASPPTVAADRHTQAVTDLLAGLYGTVMRELARDAVARAWTASSRTVVMDPAAVLLDITAHARHLGVAFTTAPELDA